MMVVTMGGAHVEAYVVEKGRRASECNGERGGYESLAGGKHKQRNSTIADTKRIELYDEALAIYVSSSTISKYMFITR
jgi:hypothetical protein